MTIHYRINSSLDIDAVIELYRASTLGERRPVEDKNRMRQMVEGANLIITAWQKDLLVGIARSLCDFSYSTYLSDLAVRVSHQKSGIGKTLIRKTQEAAGPNASLILLAAPAAEKYYAHLAFVRSPQCWLLPSQDKLAYYRKIGATDRTEWLLS